MRYLIRLIHWLFGVAPNADGTSLVEIVGTLEIPMADVTLRMGEVPRSFRIKPNKNDETVEDISRSIGGGVDGDAYVGLAQYASEPSNLLAVTLTPLFPTPAGTPSHLVGQFDSNTEPGQTQVVPFDYTIEVLPENADGSTLEEIL